MNIVLNEIVKRIVDEIKPEKIILFGSRAANNNDESGDYDICVLKKNVRHKRKIAQKIYSLLFGIGAPVDVIVETPEKFNMLKDKWFLVYREIDKTGIVVYEK